MKKIAGNPFLKKIESNIMIDLIPLNEILRSYSTPVMIFLENRIRENIRIFKDAFNKYFKNCSIFYSFKANFLPEICNIVHSEGLGAELVGLPELNMALKLGFPSEKIIVGGPYLTNELIEKSISNNVQEIIVYNLNDLMKIDSIAKKYEEIQNICLRINSQKYNSKLGIEFNKKEIIKLKNLLKRCKNIKLSTVLSHFTTQMNNAEQFKKNIQVLAETIKDFTREDIFIENINIGGGFPEASIMPENQLDKIAFEINTTLTNYEIDYKNLYIEPGRYFIGDTGIFLTEIINVTEDRWIFLNIGNHICPKFARSSLRFYNTSQIHHPHKFKTSIAGIMPTDQDVLAKDYFFTEVLEEGDIVLVTNVGAYTLTFSNRFPYKLPPILLVKGSNIRKIFDPTNDRDISLS